MRNFSIAVFVVASILGFSSLTFAGFAEFNFEDQALSASLNSLAVTNNGLTATITQTSSSFSIVDVSGNGNGELGTRTLAPTAAGGPFVINFSVPVDNFSVQLGDFGDDTDTLSVFAFSGANGTGAQVNSATAILVPIGTAFSSQTLQVTGSSILSVSVIGGANDNSVLFDNIAARPAGQAIPLPPAFYGFGSMALVAAFAYRRSLVLILQSRHPRRKTI